MELRDVKSHRAANRIHPTAKPVELIERALLNSSKARDVVADLFGGSGSTLIGCERRSRKARLMEIDPATRRSGGGRGTRASRQCSIETGGGSMRSSESV